MGHREGSPEREVHSNSDLPKEDRKISNDLTLHLKEQEKQQQTMPRTSRRKEIMKIRAELNGIEIKKQFKGLMNAGACSLKR